MKVAKERLKPSLSRRRAANHLRRLAKQRLSLKKKRHVSGFVMIIRINFIEPSVFRSITNCILRILSHEP